MSDPLTLRAMTAEEEAALQGLARSRTMQARLHDRARICWLAGQGKSVAAIQAEVGVADGTVRLWITRFNAGGLDGLRDRGAVVGRRRTCRRQWGNWSPPA